MIESNHKIWNYPEYTNNNIKKIRDSIPDTLRSCDICPVCRKKFISAPQHIYKNSRGNNVCSYTCARKSGGI